MPTKNKTVKGDIFSMLDEAKSLMVIKEYEQVEDLLEAMDDAIDEMKDDHEKELQEAKEKIESLEEDFEELEEEAEKNHVINTAFGKIHYRMEAGHLIDEQVMEALEEAFRTLTPVRIVNRLSDCICH